MVEIAAPAFHAHGFGYGNLYVIDVAAVPDGLENSVGETERHDVLDGLFTQIMIDAIDLLLVGELEQFLIEGFGRFQVVTERLFDHHPTPVVVVLLHQAGGRELFNNRTEEARSRRHVKEHVLMGGVIAVDLGQAILDLRIKRVIVEIAGKIIEAAREVIPGVDRRCSRRSTL